MQERVARTDRAVLAFSLLATAYFTFLALSNNVLRLKWIWLGAVWELLTVPLIVAVATVFVFAAVRLMSNRRSITSAPR